MHAERCECCGGRNTHAAAHADGLCARCLYFRHRLGPAGRAEAAFALLLRRHPHDTARLLRLRRWMSRRDAATAPRT